MNRQAGTPPRGICRVDALAAADAGAVARAPASLLLEPDDGLWRILAIGSPADVDAHPAAEHAEVRSRARAIVVPGLVNAHAHLDLTHIGSLDHDPGVGFVPWVDRIIAARLDDDERIGASVRRGVELARAGGTVAIGDIAGSPRTGPTLAPLRALRASGLLGVSFLEYVAIGHAERPALDRLAAFLDEHADEIDRPGLVRFGLQPHAPNTVAPGAYRWGVRAAAAHAWPLATHLAESPEERRFVAEGAGPQRELLQRHAIWDDDLLSTLGLGRTPVAHLADVLAEGPWLVAHANDADDAAIETLARTGARVAYCPRAAEYFGAARHFGPHRYRDMLEAGITVAIGTDSIANLPPDAADPRRAGISVLDEIRLLRRRDGTDAATLLGMATVQGARALGLDESLFRLKAGTRVGGLVAVEIEDSEVRDPVEAILASESRPELLLGPDNAAEQE